MVARPGQDDPEERGAPLDLGDPRQGADDVLRDRPGVLDDAHEARGALEAEGAAHVGEGDLAQRVLRQTGRDRVAGSAVDEAQEGTAFGRALGPQRRLEDDAEAAQLLVRTDQEAEAVEGVVEPPAARVEPPAPVELRFDRCVLAPGLAVAPSAKAEVMLSTVDPIRHDATVALSPALGGAAGPPKRVPLPLEGQRFVLPGEGPGVLHVGCALHEGERAVVVLPPHRHHAVVDHEGRFRLADVPAGKHKVVAWSPDGRRVEGEALVVASGTAQVTLTLP